MKKESVGEQQMEKLWLDYIEGELDPSMRADVELLLKNSTALQEQMKSLKGVRNALRSAREADSRLPEDGHYYDKLHDRIMKGVEQTHTQSRGRVQMQKAFQSRKTAYVVVFLAVGLLIGKSLDSVRVSDRAPLTSAARLQQLLLDSSSRDPDVLSDSILSHEDDIDLYLDLASKKMESMGKKEKDQVMKALKE